MKLADSWIEEDPISTPTTDFHDEEEVVDEVDEVEDGCRGVEWQPYVLKKAGTSNRWLFDLAREVQGVEKRRGRKFNVRQYGVIFDKWAAASQPFLRPGQDYFSEFLAKLNCVTVPKGETLQAAFERAKRRDPPTAVSEIPIADVRLFASLCRELHEMGHDQPIMLHQVSVSKLFGHPSHRTVSNWILALKTLGVLKLAEPAIPNARAARYFYLE